MDSKSLLEFIEKYHLLISSVISILTLILVVIYTIANLRYTRATVIMMRKMEADFIFRTQPKISFSKKEFETFGFEYLHFQIGIHNAGFVQVIIKDVCLGWRAHSGDIREHRLDPVNGQANLLLLPGNSSFFKFEFSSEVLRGLLREHYSKAIDVIDFDIKIIYKSFESDDLLYSINKGFFLK